MQGEKEEGIWNCPEFLAWTLRGGGICCGGAWKKEPGKGKEHRLCDDTGQRRAGAVGSPQHWAGA